ncbi:MAG: hypothetical protein GC185_00510 [Alphaproteobacteria bacterium]|nr:hypothetical protein [Alphaproteobacteria bacterium]
MTDMTYISPPALPDEDDDNKVSVITVNFKEGAIVGKVQFDGEGGIPKFLRDMAKFAKQDKVKSVVVLTINEDQHVDWVHVADSEHHLALAALCLDDIKEELKGAIFRDDE